MKKKSYWCPRCGRMFMKEATYRNHLNAKKCDMKESLTPKQAKAIAILRDHPGCTANTFAALYFTDASQETLFTAVSNQGNGACAGKKAWLCAGSLLGKLAKRGLVRRDYGSGTGRFYLTFKGEQQISPTNEFEGLLEQKS